MPPPGGVAGSCRAAEAPREGPACRGGPAIAPDASRSWRAGSTPRFRSAREPPASSSRRASRPADRRCRRRLLRNHGWKGMSRRAPAPSSPAWPTRNCAGRLRFGTVAASSATGLPTALPARESGAASSQGRAPHPAASTKTAQSFGPPAMLRQHLADFVDFLGRGLAILEQMQNQLACRSGKHPLHQFAQQLALHPRGFTRFVNMRLAILVAMYQPLGMHVLKQLEHAGVANGLVRPQAFVNLAHGGRAAIPKDAEDFDFGRGGLRCVFPCHAAMLYDCYRRVNDKNRTQVEKKGPVERPGLYLSRIVTD